MPLDVVYGEPRNRPVTLLLAEELKKVTDNGTIYLGYPVLATADERVYVEALLVSLDHGLVAFQVAEALPSSDSEWRAYAADQDRLYSVLESRLGTRYGRSRGLPRRDAAHLSGARAQVFHPTEGGHITAVEQPSSSTLLHLIRRSRHTVLQD